MFLRTQKQTRHVRSEISIHPGELKNLFSWLSYEKHLAIKHSKQYISHTFLQTEI